MNKLLLKSCLAIVGITFLQACGAIGKNIKSQGGLSDVKAEGGLLGGGARTGGGSRDNDSRSINDTVLGVKLKNKDFDIPVVLNDSVERWVHYFTVKGRKHFTIYLERLGQMRPIMLPKLREAGMPEDMIYLSMIESGFSTKAYSRAGAAGPWQFIRSTGKMYDLQIDTWRDERKDPYKATDAAIRYLKRLYEEFGAWELSAAAYNAGELKVRRAIERLGTRDYWEISRNRKALKKETRDYVPKLLAAAIVAKNAEQFGFEPVKDQDYWTKTEIVRLPRAEDLRTIARVAGIEKEVIRDYNPELLRSCTPPDNYELRLPKGDMTKKLLAAIESGEVGTFQDFRRLVVRRGDTLSRISSRHSVPQDAILSLNDLGSSRQIRPGMELVLPVGKFESYEPKIARRGQRRRIRRPASEYITVKQGDTAYDLSRRYSVNINKVRTAIGNKKLRAGSRIKL